MNKELCYGYPCVSETISSDFLVSRFRLKLIRLKTAQKWFVAHIKVKEVDVSSKNNVLVNLTCLQILVRWVPLGPVTVYSTCSIIRVINWYLHLIKLHICHMHLQIMYLFESMQVQTQHSMETKKFLNTSECWFYPTAHPIFNNCF